MKMQNTLKESEEGKEACFLRLPNLANENTRCPV
jgi:hypothetical protein